MKKIRTYIKHCLLASVAAILSIACTHDTEGSSDGDLQTPTDRFTYRLSLHADVEGYGNNATRSAYTWPDGASLYLQFNVGNSCISGTAVYNQAADEWTMTTSIAIGSDTDGDCEAYYFLNETSGTTANQIKLGATAAIYQDTLGSFYMTEDDVMIVKLALTPRTGRIRFKGKPGTTYVVSGLSCYTAYDIKENRFTQEKTTLSIRTDASGDTDYHYLFFTDATQRQMVVRGEGKGAYLRNFNPEVLATGKSGFIRLPSAGDVPTHWTLVNTDNLEAITLPSVSAVTVSKLRSHYATAEAAVTDLGNGTIIETGLIYSTDSNPTEANGIKVECGRSATLSARLSGLNAQTTYFILAYARNECGTVLGSAVSFTTLSEEEDGSSFGKEGYGDDDDLNDDNTIGGDIGKDGYGDDDNLNDSHSAGGNIGKDDYGDDDNLNDSHSAGGGIDKSGFDDDENWN